MPALAGVYRIPAIHTSVTGVFTHTAPTEVYRGAGRPEAVFLLETAVDHAARALGVDKLELRRRNMLDPGRQPSAAQDRPRPRNTTAATSPGHDRRRAVPRRRHRLRRPPCGPRPPGASCAASAGRMRLRTRRRRLGRERLDRAQRGRPRHRFARHHVERPGPPDRLRPAHRRPARPVPVDDIDVVQGDTDRIPSGHGTGGSASLPSPAPRCTTPPTTSSARPFPLAADALEAAPVDVEFTEGRYRIVGTDRSVGLREAAARLGQGRRRPNSTGSATGSPTAPPSPTAATSPRSRSTPRLRDRKLERYTMRRTTSAVS
jgi:carbon-monoxide dehydrogenase large subunit